MILYYSATGNSRLCAKRLAALTGDGAVDVFNYIHEGIAGEFVSDRPWIFVSPTHGWRLPGIFEGFIRAAMFSGSTEAYFVMTCGTDIGAAPAHNRALCRDKGMEYRGTLGVVMPENYLAMFAVPDEDEARDIVAAALPALGVAAADIAQGRLFPERRTTPLDALKSGVVNAAFRRFVISDRRFAATDKCVSCGKCAAVCPTRSIVMEDGHPAWTGGCVHCMACICSCPTEAIEYGRASRGKPRYRCPEVWGRSRSNPGAAPKAYCIPAPLASKGVQQPQDPIKGACVARPGCPPEADNSALCSARGVFPEVDAPGENGLNSICGCIRKSCEAFLTD